MTLRRFDSPLRAAYAGKNNLLDIIGCDYNALDLLQGRIDLDDIPGLYEALFDIYVESMPYSIASGKSEDPFEWIRSHLLADLLYYYGHYFSSRMKH